MRLRTQCWWRNVSHPGAANEQCDHRHKSLFVAAAHRPSDQPKKKPLQTRTQPSNEREPRTVENDSLIIHTTPMLTHKISPLKLHRRRVSSFRNTHRRTHTHSSPLLLTVDFSIADVEFLYNFFHFAFFLNLLFISRSTPFLTRIASTYPLPADLHTKQAKWVRGKWVLGIADKCHQLSWIRDHCVSTEHWNIQTKKKRRKKIEEKWWPKVKQALSERCFATLDINTQFNCCRLLLPIVDELPQMLDTYNHQSETIFDVLAGWMAVQSPIFY